MTEDRCPACNKAFDEREELDNHIKQDHSELSETYLSREFFIDVPHACAMCGEELDPSEPMTTHLQNAHAISNVQGEPQYEEPEGSTQAEYPEAEDIIDRAFGSDEIADDEEFDNIDNDIDAELKQELGEEDHLEGEDEKSEEDNGFRKYENSYGEKGESEIPEQDDEGKDYEKTYDIENNYDSKDMEVNECDQCNLSFDNKQELSAHKNDTHTDAFEFFLDDDNRFFEGGVKIPSNEIISNEDHLELEQDEEVEDKEEGEETNIYSSVHSILVEATFIEDEHPREQGGKFTSKGGSSQASKMQGDITTKDGTTTSKGAKFDDFMKKQPSKKDTDKAQKDQKSFWDKREQELKDLRAGGDKPTSEPVSKSPKKSQGGFDKGQTRAINFLKKKAMKYKERYGDSGGGTGYTSDIKQLQDMKGFPTSSKDIRGMDTSVKAILAKSHVQSEYPDSTFKVKTERYSGGSSFTVGYTGGAYPYGANKLIDGVYEDRGQTDLMTDYFDYDNYASMHDERPGDADRYDPQTIADSREERFSGWLTYELREQNKYEEANNPSILNSMAEDLLSNSKTTGWDSVNKEDVQGILKKFREQEKKEKGGESFISPLTEAHSRGFIFEHYDDDGTFWFTTDNGKSVGIRQGQNLEDALSSAGIPSDGTDDSDVTADDLARAEGGDGDIQEPQKGVTPSEEEPQEDPSYSSPSEEPIDPDHMVPNLTQGDDSSEIPEEGGLEPPKTDHDNLRDAISDDTEMSGRTKALDKAMQASGDNWDGLSDDAKDFMSENGDVLETLQEKSGDDTYVEDVIESDAGGSSMGKTLTLSNGEEWQVYNSMEDAEQAVKERIQDDVDSGDLGPFGGFNEDFARGYVEMSEVDQNMWVSDTENSRREDLEYQNEQLEDDDPDKKTDEEIDQAIEEEVSGIREQLSSDAVGYIESEFGEEQIQSMINDGTLKIDVERMGDDAIASDGLGHFLSSYDGNYEETSDGKILARHN